MEIKKVCVFCGSSPGGHVQYMEKAEELGLELTRRKIGLVYGGAKIGVMGRIADSVLKNGGEAIGVIPKALKIKEVAHEGLSKLHVADNMHARKALMYEISDAFIALPGGIGTLDEFFEIFTWTQLGFHQKPCGLLNVRGYYDKLLGFLNHMVSEKFVKEKHMEMLLVDEGPSAMLDKFLDYHPIQLKKWADGKN